MYYVCLYFFFLRVGFKIIKLIHYCKNLKSIKYYTMNSRSAHHPTPQNFCADTTVYMPTCPFKTTHIQMGAYSVLHSVLFCFFLT